MVLLAHGPCRTINLGRSGKGNPLQLASAKGHRDLVTALLDAGADVNADDNLFGDALQLAAAVDHEDVVRILLERGPDAGKISGPQGSADLAAVRGKFTSHDAIATTLKTLTTTPSNDGFLWHRAYIQASSNSPPWLALRESFGVVHMSFRLTLGDLFFRDRPFYLSYLSPEQTSHFLVHGEIYRPPCPNGLPQTSPLWTTTELGREYIAAYEHQGKFNLEQWSTPSIYNSYYSLDRHRFRAMISQIMRDAGATYHFCSIMF